MKNFDLNAYGVQEMSMQEMQLVDGGNIFVDAWNWIKGAAKTASEWFAEIAREHGEKIALAVITAMATEAMKEAIF